MSSGSRFWLNLRNDDSNLYKKAVVVERLAKKLRKYELDRNFLITCRDENLTPKFTRWKNLKNNNMKVKNRFYKRILIDEINSNYNKIKEAKSLLEKRKTELYSSTTYFKGIVLRTAINRAVSKNEKVTIKRHKKKLDNLLNE